MHDVGLHSVALGLVALPTALYLKRYLVSFVRGTCVLRLCCRFHRQECGYVVVIFKIEVARDFYVTKQRNSTSWGCLSTSRLLEESSSSLRGAAVADGCFISADSQLQSQPAGETHVALFRPSWKRKPFLIFVFRICREECSSGRNDAPGLRALGAKLRLHQVFWSQNLAFQSQNATMRPDFSSPALSPDQ